MANFNIDNIDLFYYHSVAFSKCASILKHGIVSATKTQELGLTNFHRNYINASCRDDYISINHFWVISMERTRNITRISLNTLMKDM